ncbi:rho guanine nucleotide exchange factor 33 [Alosa alosa]|nr:rho guanine nucleotide exchange factor 33 isoform X2 [Alosa sapidissima]XP_048126537.1 rho guanine nucleotide exchange factor 33 [Alosa alosa]
MENGKADDGDDGLVDETDLHLAQMHALWADLKSGLGDVVRDVSVLQQGGRQMEDRVSSHHRDNNEKILSIRNTINTIQEDLGGVLAQISQLSYKQKELQRDLELLQTYNFQHRKGSRGDGSLDGHASLSSQTELSLIQHYITSLPTNQISNSEPEGVPQTQRSNSKSPVWRERKESKDLTEQSNQDLSKRQTAALELLESERVYVSYLSLLLKANITFNGSENASHKDKRPFPSSLRFLIQQHLELLHVLQERVLKSQWQGIMGDVFLRLTSKESDFLEHYVSYLKELPECVSVGDIIGDDTRPSLHNLLLQPVQRIPEYLALLQSLLRQTESEHPDYYLLLVCVQHLRTFTTQYNHLLQHNQELITHPHAHTHAHTPRTHQHPHERLIQTRKELSRSSVKQLYKMGDYEPAVNYCSPSALLEPSSRFRSKAAAVNVKLYQDWEAEPHRYEPDVPSPVSFLPDADGRLKSPMSPLRSIPEAEGAGSALASALGAFLPYEGLGGGGDSSACERCPSSPSASSDSSIDIAFVRCSPAPSPGNPSHAAAAAASRRSNEGRAYRAGRGCVSPDSVGLMRPRPLQAVQRKSKSLNGLQLDSIDSPAHSGRSGVHPRLERQSSAKGRLRHHDTHAHTHTDTEDQTHVMHTKDSVSPPWGEELKWRGVTEENHHTPLSERSRKQEGGKGFRSSFKKLFKKKSSGESKDKEKDKEKSEGQSCIDLESTRSSRGNRLGEIDRGTAV